MCICIKNLKWNSYVSTASDLLSLNCFSPLADDPVSCALDVPRTFSVPRGGGGAPNSGSGAAGIADEDAWPLLVAPTMSSNFAAVGEAPSRMDK